MTKAEKQNAKKKRRKERERLARLAESGLGASEGLGLARDTQEKVTSMSTHSRLV
jgi:hypothetical protein